MNSNGGIVLLMTGAAHADELSLFFPIKHVSLIDSDQMVSDKLITMWTNFAKTG